MDDIRLLHILTVMEKRMIDVEDLVLKQAGLTIAQSQVIVEQKEKLGELEKRLDGLVTAYCKIQKMINMLIVDHNKKYDDKLDEVTDIVVSKQKYKM